ncbi:hypothetical protein ACEQPO_03620 [Bacillus sp. SL00103]
MGLRLMSSVLVSTHRRWTRSLDRTGIHPESYKETKQFLRMIKMTPDDLGTE